MKWDISSGRILFILFMQKCEYYNLLADLKGLTGRVSGTQLDNESDHAVQEPSPLQLFSALLYFAQ